MAEQLNLRPYDVQILIWKYRLKENKKYHIGVKVTDTNKSGKVHKYSKYALEFLKTKLAEQKDVKKFLNRISKEYQKNRRH